MALALGIAGVIYASPWVWGALAAAIVGTVEYFALQDAVDRYKESTPGEQARILGEMQSISSAALAEASALEELEELHIAPATLDLELVRGYELKLRSLFPELALPTLASLEQIRIWKQDFASSLILAGMSQALPAIGTWSQLEARRLELEAAIPTTPPTAVTPPTVVTPTAPPGYIVITVPAAEVTLQPSYIVVPAPLVNVALPQLGVTNLVQTGAITVEAAAAPNVAVENIVDTSSIAAALAAAIPLMGITAATATLANAGPAGHASQMARYDCMSGFLGPLLNIGTRLLPQILAGSVLLFDTPVRQALEHLVTDIFTKQFSLDKFPSPASEDTATEAAAARLLQAVGFGLTAQGIAYTAEAMTPLKQMGFNQLAGFIGDVAGFKRIADGLMGTIEQAAIYAPLRWRANRQFRPTLPGVGDLEMMYAKKEIPGDAPEGELGLSEALTKMGYSEEWIKVYKEYLWMDPRLGEVIRIGQFFSPALVPSLARPSSAIAEWMRRANIPSQYIESSDWYFAWRAAKGGYAPDDVAIIAETAKRATCRREQTLFLDAITRLARDGFITRDTLADYTLEAWAFSNPIEARLRATDLQTEYRILSDTRSVVLMSMARGLVTRDEAREKLTSLGLDSTRVELEILKATLGMIPGVRLTVSRPEEMLEEELEGT